MAGYKERMTEALVEQLAVEGDRILKECEQEADYTHRTYNLYDSYGYGIYVDGKLKRSGFLTNTATATEGNRWYKDTVKGRERLEEFLSDEYKATKGIDMVVVAAMPYAHALENQSSGQKRKYRVISMSFDKLKALSEKFPKSAVYNISAGKREVK